MTKYQILKKLLPSLFPLIVFVLVDEFYGTKAGLIVAVAFGVGEMLFTFVKDRAFDKFTFFDTLLIVVLGGISYSLENDIFFKLKPALIGAIFCILLGVSSYSKFNIFSMMSQRYLDGIDFNDEQVKQVNRSIRALFVIFTCHTLLVLYSAFYMSKEAWAFISTVVLYVLFGAYFVYEVARNKIKANKYAKEEWLPLVDQQGRVVGKAPRSIAHANPEMLHPVVHLHVTNNRKQVYLQKRPMSKLVEPGKWDMSVGGHVAVGESIETALRREAREELGLDGFSAVPVCQYIVKTEHESEFVFLFHTRYEGEIHLNPAEVEDGRFWNMSELNKQIGKSVFTPSFEIEFNILRKNAIL
jgi:isopentenyldiphosphate isomerase/intracellular septation protein A